MYYVALAHKKLIFGIYSLCSICYDIHPYKIIHVLKPFSLLRIIVARWCFRMSRTVLKYARSCFSVRPHINTPLTIIFDTTFLIPLYLANVSHSIFSFIIIATKVGAAFRPPIGITLNHQFPSGRKNYSISSA